MDFVIDLPESEGYNAILIVIDRLSKERYYIPYSTKENGTDIEATAQMIIQNVLRYYGLPTSIISDRGSQFALLVQKTLYKILGITSKLSLAFYPEIDGQSEITNQEIKRYLRTFYNYAQDDQVRKLPMAEFAANNTPSSSTKLSPFFCTKGYNPRISFTETDLSASTTRERLLK